MRSTLSRTAVSVHIVTSSAAALADSAAALGSARPDPVTGHRGWNTPQFRDEARRFAVADHAVRELQRDFMDRMGRLPDVESRARLERQLRRHVREAIAAAGLSTSRYWQLCLLCRHDPIFRAHFRQAAFDDVTTS